MTNPKQRTITRVLLLIALVTLAKVVLDAISSPSPLNIFASEVALFVLVGLVAYVKSGDSSVEKSDTGGLAGGQRSLACGLSATFVVVVSLSLLFLWQSLYVPSPLYYVALSLAVAIVGMDLVQWHAYGGKLAPLILAKISIIGLIIQLSFAWLNPKSVGSDLYYDWSGILSIAQSGSIPESLGYFYYFPSFHVFNAVVLELTGIGFDSYLLFNHVVMILAIPFSYILARRIVTEQKALLSALLMLVSQFFFLSAAVLPVLLGAAFMLIASYALIQQQTTMSLRWWVAFWLLALFVFFSHPVNALILAILLGVVWVVRTSQKAGSSRRILTTPAATYTVAYLGYLGFIAVNALTIFVQSLVESGPKIYFASSGHGTVPTSFLVETIMSTLGLAVLFLPATFAILLWLFKGRWNQRFLIGLIMVLAAVPALAVLTGKGPYGLQAARTLMYLSIFITIPAASGLLYLTQRLRGVKTRGATVMVILLVLTLLSSTSYLTGSGNRFLSDAIPAQPSYVTDSMLSIRDFMQRVPDKTPLTLDPALAVYLAPWNSGLGYPVTPFPLEHSNLVAFPSAFGNTSVVLTLSDLYLSSRGFEAPDTSFLDASYAVRAYDNGMVRVYAPPGG